MGEAGAGGNTMTYNPTWVKSYEQEMAANYICSVTNVPCRNCSKYGCEHRVKNDGNERRGGGNYDSK